MNGMTIKKRDGREVLFDKDRIIKAVEGPLREINIIPNGRPKAIAETIELWLDANEDMRTVERIQDKVEELLMFNYPDTDVAKRYILYREMKTRERHYKENNHDYKLLDKEFLAGYKKKQPPVTALGSATMFRSYTRYIPELGRRERWDEAVARAVEYIFNLDGKSNVDEAKEFYDNVFNLRQFPAGRTLYTGGTLASKKYPLSNFNCAFRNMDGIKALRELSYVLMVGAGVGLGLKKEVVNLFPRFNSTIKVVNLPYEYVGNPGTQEGTTSEVDGDILKVKIGDSKEGWAEAVEVILTALSFDTEHEGIKTVEVNYNAIRPNGTTLKTFGGTASGPETLMEMFINMSRIIKRRGEKENTTSVKLRPTDVLDMANLIGENVVAGGVRRTAELGLLDETDEEAITAKTLRVMYETDKDGNFVTSEEGNFILKDLMKQRYNSNNTIARETKPTYPELEAIINQIKNMGEPGIMNMEAARVRYELVEGVNPCAEIFLMSSGVCNLTTINVMAFAEQIKDGDYSGILRAQWLSARVGVRMTMLELELPEWDKVQKSERLIGTSLTGWMDMVEHTGIDELTQRRLLNQLRDMSIKSADDFADELGINRPKLKTTIKPEGTLSLLPTVSPGLHNSFAPYYIRRVQFSTSDRLVGTLRDLNFRVVPKIGQEDNTVICEFPVKSPRKSSAPIPAITQLETYKMFMTEYVQHNASVTITIQEHEWEEVTKWIFENWDSIVAISLLPDAGTGYLQMPLEEITKEQYEEMTKDIRNIALTDILKYEDGSIDVVDFTVAQECTGGGACGIV